MRLLDLFLQLGERAAEQVMAFPGLFNSLQDSGSCLDTLPQFDQMGSLVELLGKGQHNSVAVEKTVTTNMLEGSAGICGPESSQQAAETQHDDDTASFTEMGDAEAAQEHGEAGAGVEEQDQDEQPQGPVLTQTLHMGIQDMDASIANIEQKVGEQGHNRFDQSTSKAHNQNVVCADS